MNITVQPVPVAIEQGEGLLVFAEGKLAAVLVRLSAIHDDMAGHWFLETAIGEALSRHHPVFQDVDEASVWIAGEIGRRI